VFAQLREHSRSLPRLVRAAAFFAGVAALPLGAIAADVSTYAGSGRAGTADGRGADASFILPVGVAWDSKNDLFVSDAAAQRIRVVSPDGTTRTLAGTGEATRTGLWVRGGYADGTGPAARFNGPMGIAVGPHDELYVADSGNHCIRRVTAAGEVTTYAGDPHRPGAQDGPRGEATFSDPVAVTVGAQGDLYVADVVAGVRRIAPDGAVTTLALPFKAPLGIVYPGHGVSQLWISTAGGLWRVDLDPIGSAATRVGLYRSGSIRYPVPPDEPGVMALTQAGQVSLGYPFALTAIDPQSILFTDVVTHTIRYLNATSQDLQVVGGRARDDAAADSGGLQDGSSDASRFDAPMGIAARAGGVVAVADSGNKCIRLIRAIDRSHPFFPQVDLLPDTGARDGDYRIALVGNSSVWGAGTFADSVGGRIESDLNASPAFARGRKVRVIPFKMGSDLAALRRYVEFLVSAKQVDDVVVQLDDFFWIGPQGISEDDALAGDIPAGAWQDRLSADIKGFAASLRAAGVPVLFVIHPLATEVGLNELTLPKMLGLSKRNAVPDGRAEEVNATLFRSSGVNWLDTWPAFDDDLRSAGHAPLFLSIDGHFTPHGDAVLGDAIAKRLLLDHPWAR
jgi:streptogramin lyase